MITLLAASLTLALQAAPSPPQVSPATVEDFAQARTALAAQLPNYPDTWFRNTRGNFIMFCGEMNTQTDLGAFTGWLHFAIVHYNEGPARLYVEGRDDKLVALCNPAVFEGAPGETGPDYSAEMIYR